MPSTMWSTFMYIISFKPHNNALGGLDIIFHYRERSQGGLKLGDWLRPKATDLEELGFRSSPHSFLKIEKLQMDGEVSKGQESPA